MENIKKEDIEAQKRTRLWMFVSLAFVIIALLLSFVAFFVLSNSQDKVLSSFEKANKNSEDENANKNLVRRKIDGTYVEVGRENIYPLAIMIDNHEDARPQSGLSQANLVIEAEAEGGITRFLAFFATDQDLEKIGPIRSARPYYIDWAYEFNALYAHVGGSPEALAKLKKENILHINEYYNEIYFWRDHERLSPHNVYTSTQKLYDYLEKNNIGESEYFGWRYKDDLEFEKRPDHGQIMIEYSLPEFEVTWEYKKQKNNYLRFNNEEKYVDAEGNHISAKNIVIQIVEAEEVDEELRLEMKHIGDGDAIICLDGECKEGKWKKRNASARTRFYNLVSEGEINKQVEVEFNAGSTWIEVVRPEYKVEY